MNKTIMGRLAPSPTGFIHLGNAWSFLWAWVFARAEQGGIILRMEDIDPDRSRQEFATAIGLVLIGTGQALCKAQER